MGIQPILCQDQNHIDQYFIHIKSLEFGKAQEISENLSNHRLSELMIKLSDILYDAGQNSDENDFILKQDFRGDFELALSHLITGFRHLYYHSTQSNAFVNFEKAYKISLDLNYNPLTKQCLLGILELYHSEILQSNKEYLNYLELYKSRIEDSSDWFWYYLYDAILRSKTIFNMEQLSSENLISLDSIMERTTSISQDLQARYFYEKAIHTAFDGRNDLARKYYARVIKISDKPFSKYMRFGSYIRLSELDTKDGFYKEALKKLDSSKKYVSTNDSIRGKFHINRYAASTYERLVKYDSAYFLLKKSIQQEYELDFKRNSLEITRLNVLYRTAEKEKQILKEQQRAETNRNWLIAATLALFLGIGIAILFQKNTAKKRKLAEQEVLLKQQRVENLLKEQELIGIDAMISGQEKERQRLANDLHDNLGSLLTSVKMHFQSLKQDLSQKEQKEITKKTESLMEEAYQKVRGIAHVRNAGLKASQGLLPAVHTFVKKVSVLDKLAVNVEEHGMTERLENSLEITIFRIIQELVTNVAKHAYATECTVHLTNHKHTLNIMVEDNGKGFELDEMNKKEGMGLYSIQKRVENLDGQVTFESILKKGTSIIIDIPLA